jgi:hypothetical protein
MPAGNRKRSNKADIHRSKDMGSAGMNFDVVEWLEGERLEHDRRMQELGCPYKSTEEFPETSDKQHKKSVST